MLGEFKTFQVSDRRPVKATIKQLWKVSPTPCPRPDAHCFLSPPTCSDASQRKVPLFDFRGDFLHRSKKTRTIRINPEVLTRMCVHQVAVAPNSQAPGSFAKCDGRQPPPPRARDAHIYVQTSQHVYGAAGAPECKPFTQRPASHQERLGTQAWPAAGPGLGSRGGLWSSRSLPARLRLLTPSSHPDRYTGGLPGKLRACSSSLCPREGSHDGSRKPGGHRLRRKQEGTRGKVKLALPAPSLNTPELPGLPVYTRLAEGAFPRSGPSVHAGLVLTNSPATYFHPRGRRTQPSLPAPTSRKGAATASAQTAQWSRNRPLRLRATNLPGGALSPPRRAPRGRLIGRRGRSRDQRPPVTRLHRRVARWPVTWRQPPESRGRPEHCG
ncbi:uncharacterized protein LOC123617174 [Camelus bactrianus]|uniref:Uncharacterized protein LOC123617174 n=3 Tax=Camelus bactrianus TaxID=9837 RepID=A0AC58PMQ0_CAMBA